MYYEYYASNMILLISLINQLSSRSPPPFRTLAPTNGRVSPWASSGQLSKNYYPPPLRFASE